MSRIEIIQIGKDKASWLTESSNHFCTLLKRYAQINIKTIKNPKLSTSYSIDEIKSKESELFHTLIAGKKYIALSDSGLQFDSIRFSKWLGKKESDMNSHIRFLIGGPYGLADDILTKADSVISMSQLTMSHQLIRLVLLEQLFRAFSILNNTDYHK